MHLPKATDEKMTNRVLRMSNGSPREVEASIKNDGVNGSVYIYLFYQKNNWKNRELRKYKKVKKK